MKYFLSFDEAIPSFRNQKECRSNTSSNHTQIVFPQNHFFSAIAQRGKLVTHPNVQDNHMFNQTTTWRHVQQDNLIDTCSIRQPHGYMFNKTTSCIHVQYITSQEDLFLAQRKTSKNN